MGGSDRRSARTRSPLPRPAGRCGPGRAGRAPRSKARSRPPSPRPLLLLLRLAVLSTLLVDGAGGPFLGLVLADAAVLVRILDVLVLTLALVAPGLLRHRSILRGGLREPIGRQRGRGRT